MDRHAAIMSVMRDGKPRTVAEVVRQLFPDLKRGELWDISSRMGAAMRKAEQYGFVKVVDVTTGIGKRPESVYKMVV